MVIVILAGTLLVGSTLPAMAKQVRIGYLNMWWREVPVQAMKEVLAEFEKLYPDIKVEETRTSWSSGMQELETSFAGGTLPDVFHMGSGWQARFYRLGMLAPLNDYITKETREDIYKPIWELFTFNGDIVEIPSLVGPWGITYRKDLFEKAGLKTSPEEFPETWGQCVLAAMKLTKDLDGDGRIDQWGVGTYLILSKVKWNWLPVMYLAGCYVLEEEDGKWSSTVNTPEGLLGLQSWWELVHAYKIMPQEILSVDYSAALQNFVNAKYATFWGGMFFTGSLKELPELEGKWGLAEYPKLTDERCASGSVYGYAMSKVTRHPKEAFLLLDFLSNAENATKLCIADDSVVPRKSQADHPFYLEERNVARMGATQYTRTPPLCPAWEEIMEKVYAPMVHRLTLGEITPEVAAKDMDKEANRILIKYGLR